MTSDRSVVTGNFHGAEQKGECGAGMVIVPRGALQPSMGEIL